MYFEPLLIGGTHLGSQCFPGRLILLLLCNVPLGPQEFPLIYSLLYQIWKYYFCFLKHWSLHDSLFSVLIPSTNLFIEFDILSFKLCRVRMYMFNLLWKPFSFHWWCYIFKIIVNLLALMSVVIIFFPSIVILLFSPMGCLQFLRVSLWFIYSVLSIYFCIIFLVVTVVLQYTYATYNNLLVATLYHFWVKYRNYHFHLGPGIFSTFKYHCWGIR